MTDKAYYKKNRENIREQQRQWYLKNRENIKARAKARYDRLKEENGPDYHNMLWRNAYRNKPEQYRQQGKIRRARQRTALLEAAGGARCVRCGFADARALQIDHISGGGCKERVARPQLVKSKYLREDVLANPGKYQVLCANCNWIKKDENKEYGGNRKITHFFETGKYAVEVEVDET